MGARRRWDPYSNTMHAVDEVDYFAIVAFFQSTPPPELRPHSHRVTLGGRCREYWVDISGAVVMEATSFPLGDLRIRWETLKVREDYLEAYYG